MNAHACVGCPLNVVPTDKEPSEFLLHIVDLDDMLQAGYRGDLPLVEWRALALLKRKRNEAEIRKIKTQGRA